MTTSHIFWALVGMASYSLTTLFVKFAMRAGMPSGVAVAVATTIVATTCWSLVAIRGQFGALFSTLPTSAGAWAVLTGIVLALAVSSLFRALELGPASVVVPTYGMFVVGGAVLGVLFLGEALTPTKALGIAAAVCGIYLICV